MSSENENKTRIYKDADQVEAYFKKNVGLGTSFDLGVRKFVILKTDIQMYYVNGLCDTSFITDILSQLVHINDQETNKAKVFEIIENRLVNQSVSRVETLDEMVDQVLSGLIAVIVDGKPTALVVDVRSYPGRSPEEPDTEKVVRGSRDG